MELLAQFKAFLFSQEVKPSKVTVKNYLSDINHFVRWYESHFNQTFEPKSVTHQTIEQYKNENPLSPRSVERHLSSLRKFFTFLKLEGKISYSPFEMINGKSSMVNMPDPWHIKDFKSYLYVFNASHLTIKNYLIDIKQFLNWAQEVLGLNDSYDLSANNLFEHISGNLLEEYKQRLIALGTFSPATINRKLSSLRKYTSWLEAEGLISQPAEIFNFQFPRLPKPGTGGQAISNQFNNETIQQLTENKDTESQPRTKNQEPRTETYSPFPPYRLLQKVTKGINLAVDATLITQLVKIIEKAEILLWKTKGQPVFTRERFTPIKNQRISADLNPRISNIKKELYAPLEISTKYFPWYKKAWFSLRYKRPNWYKTYHSYAIVHYFHFAVLVIFAAGLVFGFYTAFVGQQKTPTLAANVPTNPKRILNFQGRLTDASDNPITSATNLRFSIYTIMQPGTGSAILLWQEVDQVTPDTDGIFNSILGNTATVCANPLTPATGQCSIPSSLFSENNALFLGVTVETTPELTPRQQLATVAFASNSETLQGLLPITATAAGTTNVVLALDSTGNLTIGGSATPIFQATGGLLTLSGQPLLLTTKVGSNGNIQLAPDGTGRIDLTKPLQNTSISNNISTAVGSVEIDDLFSILATSSGQSALTINQTGAGPLISASASGASKFTVGNDGTGTFAGNVTIDSDAASGGELKFSNDTNQPSIQNQLNNITIWNSGSAKTWEMAQFGVANYTYIRSGAGNGGGQNVIIDSRNAFTSGNLTSFSNAGVEKASVRFDGAFISSAYTNAGGILYTSTTGLIGQSAVGTASQCLIGGATPSWSSCSAAASNFWQRNAGALSPLTSSDDLLLGSNATSTAAFAFTGLKGNQTQASFSGQLIVMPNNGNGGFVGIGTTSPASPLSVRYHAANTGVGTAGIVLDNPSGGTQNILAFRQNGTDVARIRADSSGNLLLGDGVGTLTTTHINSELNMANNIVGRVTALYGQDNGNLTISPNRAATDTTEGDILLQTLNSATDARVTAVQIDSNGANPSVYLVPTGTGGVGIGNTTPLTALDVTGSASLSANLSLRGAATAHTFNVLDNGTLNIQRSPGGDTSLATALFVQNNGNVGIGTTGPSNLLDLYSTADSSLFRLHGNSITNGGLYGYSAGGNSGMFSVGSEKVAGSWTARATSASLFGADNNSSAAFFVYANTGLTSGNAYAPSEVFRITTSGNVGIGTTNPSSFILQTAGNVGPNADITYDLGSPSLQWRNVYAQNFIGGTSGIQGYWQRTLGSLAPTNITDDLLLGSIATTTAQFSVSNIAKNQAVASVSGNLIVMANNGWGGNVGIGTTNPGSKLEVNGTATATNVTSTATASVFELQLTRADGTSPAIYTTGLSINGIRFIGGTGSHTFGTGGGGGTNQFAVSHTASAVNYINVTGAITTASPVLSATGSDTNVSLNIAGKGTGQVNLSSQSTNYVTIAGQSTGVGPLVAAVGGDSNIVLDLRGKGTQGIYLGANQAEYLYANGAATTGTITLAAVGTDTDVAFNIDSKGADALNLNNNATGDVNIAGGSGATGCTIANSTGNLTCTGNITSVSGIVGFWQRNLGAISPTNITDDLLIGGTSTASAVFAFTGMSSLTHQTQASFSGQLIVMPNNGYGGNVGIGTTGPNNRLEVLSTTTPQIRNSYDGSNYATWAVSSAGNTTFNTTGTGGFTFSGNPQIYLTGTGPGIYLNNGTVQAVALALGAGANPNLTFNNSNTTMTFSNAGVLSGLTGLTSSGTITFSGFTGANNGGVIYANSSGVLSQTAAGGATDCLIGGTTPSWSSCSAAALNYWQRTSGSLAPANITDSINIGAIATSSATVHLAGTAGENSFINTGNVGIGLTSNIDSILSINANAGNTSTAGGISLLGTNQNYGARMTVYDTGTGIQEQFVLKVGGTYDSTPAMVIGGPGNTRNIGIGTTTPLTALDVTGSASLSANMFFRGAATAHTFNILDNGTLNIQRSPGGDAGLASVVYISNNGNVGLGTSTFNGTTNNQLRVVGNAEFGNATGIGAAPVAGQYLTLGATSQNLVIPAGSTSSISLTSTAGTAVGGILFSTDTTLYRSAADTLKTDDRLSVGTLNSSASNVLCYDGSNILSTCISSLGTNYWQRNLGALSPTNITDDLLIGSTATSTAQFSVSGIAKNQAVASLSGQLIVMPNNGWGGQAAIGYNNPGTATLAVNGNVGIGTTSPFGLLSNYGSNIVDQAAVGLQTGAGGSLVWNMNQPGYVEGLNQASTASNAMGLLVKIAGTANTNSILTLNSSGTDRFTVTGAGNVGIGTTGPSYPLDVTGDVRFTGGLGLGSSVPGLDGRLVLPQDIVLEGNPASGTYVGIIGSPAGNNTGVGYNPTISANAAYSRSLLAAETVATGVTVTNRYGVYIENPALSGTGAITTNYGIYLSNQTSGGTDYAIYSDGGQSYFGGNVGIGTTNPTDLLQLKAGAFSMITSDYAAGTTGSMLQLSKSGSTGNVASTLQAYTAGASAYGNIALNAAGGNVGIGTTAPGANLHVNGTGNTEVRIQSTAASQIPVLRIIDNDNGDFSWEVGRSSLNGIRLFDNTTTATRLMVDGSGNFAIGSGNTTPLATLDLRGNSGITPVSSISGQTSFAALVVDNKGVGDIFTASTSGYPRFTITNQGNVVMGKLGDPGKNITIYGSGTSPSSISLLGTSGNGVSLTSGYDGTDSELAAVYGLTITAGNGTTGDITFRSKYTGSFVNQLRILGSNNNVGIGTTTPISELHVTRPLSFGTTGKALAIFDQIESQDILTASAGGATKFTISNTGALTDAAYTNAGGVLYTSTTGLIGQTAIGTATDCLIGGTTPAFSSCASAAASSIYWTQANGALYPKNSTVDLLVGGTTTASAQFSVTGINNNRAVASVSGNLIVMANNGWGGQVGIGYNSPGTATLAVNGNVGIGTTAPTANLQINGAGTMLGLGSGPFNSAFTLDIPTGTARIGSISIAQVSTTKIAHTGDNTRFLDLADAAGVRLSGGSVGLKLDTASANDIIFSPNSVEAMRIQSGGNVGIGTTSPTALLDVAGAASVGGQLTFRSGTAQIQSTVKQLLTIGGDTTGDIQFKPGNSSTSLYLQTGGNVGIGLTNPGSTLDVLSSATTGTGINFAANSVTSGIGVRISAIGLSSGNALGVVGTSNYTGASNASLSYSQYTAAPTGSSSTGFGAVMGLTQTTAGSFIANNMYGIGGIALNNSTSGSVYTAIGAYGQVQAAGAGGTITNAYAIAASYPYLAAGSITNAHGLHINNQGAAGVTNAVGLYVDAQSGAATTNYAAIFAGGNVGIGTTSPAQLLEVSGANAKTKVTDTGTGYTYTQWGNVTSSNFVGTENTTGASVFVGGLANAGVVGTGGSTALQLGTSGTIRMTILSAGNVGIGTTSPAAKLQVADAAGGGTGNTLPSNTQVYVSGAYSSGSVDATYGRIFLGADQNQYYGSYLGTRRDSSGGIHMQLGIDSNNTLVDAVDINSSGNVGIGTTAPTALLDVAGTASVGGVLKFRSGTAQIQSTVNQALTIGGDTTGNITLSPGNSVLGSNVTPGITNQVDLGTAALQWRNVYAQNFIGGTSGIQGYWQRTLGALSPTNITDDLLLGSIATSTAQFSVSNIAKNQAVASLSGNLIVMANNGWGGNVGIGTTAPVYRLDVGGIERISQTVSATTLGNSRSIILGQFSGANNERNEIGFGYKGSNTYQPVVIGHQVSDQSGASTGDFYVATRLGTTDVAPTIRFDILNTGNIGLGTTAPISELHVTRPLSFGATGKALAIFDQIENQDIFTASKSGVTQFTISNIGAVQANGAIVSLSHIQSYGNLYGDDLYLGFDGTSSTIRSFDTNENISIIPNGTGNVGIGTTSPTALLHVNGGYSNNAALIVNNLNSGDLFTASASGVTKFKIGNTGAITDAFYATCTLKTDANGLFTCGTDLNTGVNWWNQLAGALSPVDINNDFLIGGTATSTAEFSFTGVKTGNTIASVSGNLIVMANNGWGGQVGIGTTSPGQKLSVVGSIDLLTGSTTNLTISNGSTGGLGGTGSNVISNWDDYRGNSISPKGAGYDLNIRGDNGASYVNRITLPTGASNYVLFNGGGNVGIGDTSPDAFLEVLGTTEQLRLTHTDGTIDARLTLDASGNLTIDASTDGTGSETLTLTGFSTLTASSLTTLSLGTSATINAGATALNLQAEGTPDVNIAGGSSATGCTILNASGNLACSGGIYSTATTGLQGWWNVASGSLYPTNSTLDFIFGSQASVSARFKLTANNFGAGTLAVASISGKTSFASLVVNNDGVGDLFTASASGWTRFAITNAGAFNLKGAYGSNGDCLKSGGSSTVAVSWGTCGTGGGDSFWGQANGLLYPGNSTVDLAIGGVSSASAKFLFANVNSGTPTLKIFDSTKTFSLNLSHDGTNANILSTTGTINIGQGGGTLYIQTDIQNDGALFGSGIQITDKLNILPVATGNVNSNAAFIVNNPGTGDILTASGAGTTRFKLANTGTITASFYNTCTLKTDTNGLFTCGTDNSGGAFSELLGAIVPNNSTEDFFIGGQSTASAKFAILNISAGGSNDITASLSGNIRLNPGNGTISKIVAQNGNNLQLLVSVGGKNGDTLGLHVANGTGFIGLGTSSPQERLDISGNATISGNLTFTSPTAAIQSVKNQLLTIGGNTTGNIILNPNNGTSGGVVKPGADNVTNLGASPSARWKSLFLGPGSLHISCLTTDAGCPTSQGIDYSLGINSAGTFGIGANLNSNSTPAFNITQGGNVGIGTTAPTALLHVNGGYSNNAALIVNNVNSGDIIAASASGATKFRVLNAGTIQAPSFYDIDSPSYFLDPAATGTSASVAGSLTFNGASTAHTIDILNNGTLDFTTSPGGDAVANSRLFIQNNGNVGIGTTAPDTKLTVNFDSGTSLTGTTAYGGFHFQPSGTDNDFVGITAGANNAGVTRIEESEAGILFQSGSTYGTRIHFLTTDNFGTGMAQRMIINESGNVGIGTTSPDNKLDVGGVIRGQSETLSGDVLVIGNDSKLVDIDVANTAAIYGVSDTTVGSLRLGSAGAVISGYSGRIGIGTTTPQAGLQVYSGSAIIGSPSVAGPHYIQLVHAGGTAAENRGFISFANSTAAPEGEFVLGASGTTGQMFINYNSVEKLAFTNTGTLKVTGEVISTLANTFRMVQGNYGSFFRNDGADIYLLLTASLDQYGSWNTLRPFRVTNSTGAVYINSAGSGTTTLGNTSAALVIDSTAFRVTSAGAVSGVTTITTSGAINGQTISSAANFTGSVTIATTLAVGGAASDGVSITNSASPTITFKDTDNRTGYWHMNSDIMYLLSGANGAGIGGWAQVGGQWPLMINTSTNLVTVGGDLAINGGNITTALTLDSTLTATGAITANGGITCTTCIALASEVSGTLPVANGGTGVTTSTGTGNVVLSAAPTLTGTITVDIITFTGSTTWDVDTGTSAPCATGASGLCFDSSVDTPAYYFGTAGNLIMNGTLSQSGNPDVAENIKTNDSSVEAGDIVFSTTYNNSESNIYNKAIASKTSTRYSQSIIGAISEGHSMLLNANLDDNLGTINDPYLKPLTIAGRIPVKVSTINGAIKAGDLITSSEIPGVGMKATKAGMILGTALTDYEDTQATQSARLVNGEWTTSDGVCQQNEQNCYNYEKILVLIQPGWQDPDVYLTSTGDLNLADQTASNAASLATDFTIPHYFTLNDALGNPIDRVGAFSQLISADIRAGSARIEQLSTNSLAVVTDNITIAGQSLRDYIATIVNDVISNSQFSIFNQFSSLNTQNIISPIASIDTLNTDLISPLTNDHIEIAGDINIEGSATFSGKLTSDNLQVTNDASISGTLRAGRILATDIVGLNIQAATISANYITNNYYTASASSNLASSFPTLSASSSGTNPYTLNANNYISVAPFASELAYVKNLNAATATFSQGLMVFGSTTLSDTSVVGQLSVNGSLILADNSINVLGSDLNLQPLRQGGLSIMAGLIYIDTNGNATFEKDATVKGTLYANAISSLPGQDLTLKLATGSGILNTKYKIQNTTGSDILSVNQLGDLIASGAGTFSKLNLGLVSPALALSPTEVIATGSAGVVTLKANKTQVTVLNNLVTEKSLIYITPVGQTLGQNLYLLRQIPDESFTVGINAPVPTDIKFNFLIIN